MSTNELRKLGASSRAPMAPGTNDAVSLLTGGVTKSNSPSKVSNSNEESVKSARPKEQSIAQIRWRDLKTKCLIKEINMNSVTAW